MENTIKHLTILDGLDLTDFYAINLWKYENEIALQGYFTDRNLDIVKSLDVQLILEGHFLRGYTTTEFGKLKITLSTKE